MNARKIILIILFFLPLLLSCSKYNGPVTIECRVAEKRWTQLLGWVGQYPFSYALVTLEGTGLSRVSDSDGDAIFEDIAPGVYKLSCNFFPDSNNTPSNFKMAYQSDSMDSEFITNGTYKIYTESFILPDDGMLSAWDNKYRAYA
ncbi:MAG: hypothetical protein ACUZ8I_12570 [Candidatus Scalindua sp.]